jgi:hypothetical protein
VQDFFKGHKLKYLIIVTKVVTVFVKGEKITHNKENACTIESIMQKGCSN